MNTKYTSGRVTIDYLDELETSFSKQSLAGFFYDDEVQVTISVSSLVNTEDSSGTGVALKTLAEAGFTWKKLNGRVVVKRRSIKQRKESRSKSSLPPINVAHVEKPHKE